MCVIELYNFKQYNSMTQEFLTIRNEILVYFHAKVLISIFVNHVVSCRIWAAVRGMCLFCHILCCRGSQLPFRSEG